MALGDVAGRAQENKRTGHSCGAAQSVCNADLIVFGYLRVNRKQNYVILSELGLAQVMMRLPIRITRLAMRAHDAA
jgi:hypothetical protein